MMRTVPDANVLPDAKQEQPKAATLFNNMTLIALTLCKGVITPSNNAAGAN
jgi:hypothetical protein